MLFPEDESSQHGRSRGLLLGLMVAALAAGGGLWWWQSSGPAPDVPVAGPERGASRPSETARAATPAPKVERDAAPVRAARKPAPVEAPTPPPAPEAPVSRGVLRVRSDVDGASVFLDRTFLGTTPLEKTGLTPGSHRVNVSAEGYDGIAQTVEIGDAPAEISVKFKEVRLDASTPVVHKHGVGSCQGRLVGTVQGLRYDTSNRGDAFEAPFARVQGFEVDYLKKNLRVRIAGGKTYNFTDPSGNADALFVFHRDVEKARAKLAAQ
jgi:PEGA domain